MPLPLAVVELQPSEHAVQLERKRRALEELASQLTRKYSLLRADKDGGRKVGGLAVCQVVGVSVVGVLSGGCVGGGCVEWWVC